MIKHLEGMVRNVCACMLRLFLYVGGCECVLCLLFSIRFQTTKDHIDIGLGPGLIVDIVYVEK